MTCIVAVEDHGTVYMGADRASSNFYSTSTHDAAKVFEVGPLLIGIAGSWRMGQVLQYGLIPPVHTLSWDVDRWVATDLMAAVRATFEAHAWHRVEHGSVASQRGVWLLAVAGRAYCIQGDYSWQRHTTGEYANGSGEDFALGSLHTTRGQEPSLRVMKALEAAAEHSPTVAGPFDIVTQEA